MALSRGNLESLGKDNGEGETGSHTSRCCPTMSLPALFRLPSRVHRGYDRRMPSMVPPFTATQAAVLKNFLASPQRPTGTLTYPQLAGFLFSLANGPELIPPSEWIPMVFDDHDAGYDTQAEAEQVLQAMMALYNDCARQYFADRPTLPPGCDIRPAPSIIWSPTHR